MITKSIPYGHQHINEEDVRAVIAALTSDYMTQGPLIGQFEKNFANYLGCQYACMVSNGTAALHLCAMALDIKMGDKVKKSKINKKKRNKSTDIQYESSLQKMKYYNIITKKNMIK